MNVVVVLFKKEGTYFSKEKNKDVPFTDFYLRVNQNPLIPIEVKYFKNPKFDGRDPGYSSRVATLSALAGTLPSEDNIPGEIVFVPTQHSLMLYKQEGTFFSKEKGKDVPYVNLFIKVNDNEMIPFNIKYFKNDKFDGRDPGYASRIGLVSGIAKKLVDKSDSEVTSSGQASIPTEELPL